MKFLNRSHLVLIALCIFSGAIFGQLTSSRDGKLDTSFGINGVEVSNPRVADYSYSFGGDFTQTPDGKIVAMYVLDPPTGFPSHLALIRYQENGESDPTFGKNGEIVYPNLPGFLANRVLVQQDGRILVAGISVEGSDFIIFRFTETGQPDTGFGTNGVVTKDFGVSGNFSVDSATSILVQSDGKIIVAGISYRGVPSQGPPAMVSIVRLNPNGSIDKTFGNGGVSIQVGDTLRTDAGPNPDDLKAILSADGKIIVATTQIRYTSPTSTDYHRYDIILRFLPDGNLDPSFSKDGIADYEDTAMPGFVYPNVFPDGKILFTTQSTVSKYNADGSRDNTFWFSDVSFDAFYPIYCSTTTSDGKILLVGGKSTIASPQRTFSVIRRLWPDGTLDIKFGNHGESLLRIDNTDAFALRLASISNNKLLIFGNYGSSALSQNAFFARYFITRKG